MASFVFNRGALNAQNGGLGFTSNTIKARLVSTSETLNKDATVMTGIGISGYDVTLSGKTGPTEDMANDRIGYDSIDITFTGVTIRPEVNRVVFFKFVTSDADSVPICCNDIVAVTPNNGDITVTLDANGIFYSQQ